MRTVALLPLLLLGAAAVACRRGEDADATTSFSRALYTNDGALVLCLDVDARGKLHGGGWTVKDREEAIARVESADAGAPMGTGRAVTLERKCSDALPDATELARCTAGDESYTVHYYSFAALEKDRETNCKKVLHGSWKALPPDSAAYGAARAAYDAQRTSRMPPGSQGSSW